jgi:hypothetical protein
MSSRVAAIVFRLLFGALSLAAVGAQFFLVQIPSGDGILNFFSLFTYLATIFIGVVFIISAVRLIRNRTQVSASEAAIRGAAVVYIVFVGLVFNTILRDVPIGGLLPWVNAVCHFILPIAGLFDWLVWPPRRRIPLATAFWWVSFPLVYTVYSLVREAVTGWYPYPFFHPAAVGGYGGVALYCAGMLVGFLVLALLLRWVANALGARRDARLEGARPVD